MYANDKDFNKTFVAPEKLRSDAKRDISHKHKVNQIIAGYKQTFSNTDYKAPSASSLLKKVQNSARQDQLKNQLKTYET